MLSHLVEQWKLETKKFLEAYPAPLVIEECVDLEKFPDEDFRNAAIILVNSTLLGSDAYSQAMQHYAATPGLPSNGGRHSQTLQSLSRWVLSGTPPIHDFDGVRSMAELLGINLGRKEVSWKATTSDAARDRINDTTGRSSSHI